MPQFYRGKNKRNPRKPKDEKKKGGLRGKIKLAWRLGKILLVLAMISAGLAESDASADLAKLPEALARVLDLDDIAKRRGLRPKTQ